MYKIHSLCRQVHSYFKLPISNLLMTWKCKEPCHQQLGCWIIYTGIFQPQQQKRNYRNESSNVCAYLIIKNIFWRIDSKKACLECVEDCVWQSAVPSLMIRHISWWLLLEVPCTIVSYIIQVVRHTILPHSIRSFPDLTYDIFPWLLHSLRVIGEITSDILRHYY